MKVTVSWDNPEKTALRFDLRGQWQWPELRESMCRAAELLNTVNHPVGVILIPEDGQRVPGGVLMYSKELLTLEHPNFNGHAVFVGGRRIFMVLDSVVRQTYAGTLFPVNTHYADTLDDARNILRNQAAPIP